MQQLLNFYISMAHKNRKVRFVLYKYCIPKIMFIASVLYSGISQHSFLLENIPVYGSVLVFIVLDMKNVPPHAKSPLTDLGAAPLPCR